MERLHYQAEGLALSHLLYAEFSWDQAVPLAHNVVPLYVRTEEAKEPWDYVHVGCLAGCVCHKVANFYSHFLTIRLYRPGVAPYFLHGKWVPRISGEECCDHKIWRIEFVVPTEDVLECVRRVMRTPQKV